MPNNVDNTTTANILMTNYDNFNKDVVEVMDRSIKANGLYQATNQDIYQKFKRVATLDPYRRLNYTKEYLFFTKPDLQILDGVNGQLRSEVSNVPIFEYIYRYYPYILPQLQISADSNTRPFMNIMSNFVSSNLELPAIQAANDFESPQNIHGTKITFRNTSYASDDGYEFSLDFRDTKYLELYLLLKAYDEYENRKTYGQITVPHSFVEEKIIHDQFSIYKFIVDEDFTSIIFWAKVTGAYPKNVPRDTFSDLQENGGIQYSVNFKGAFVEEMDYDLLTDFNMAVQNAVKSYKQDVSLWDNDLMMVNPDWCNIPYIEFPNQATEPNGLPLRPKLRWR